MRNLTWQNPEPLGFAASRVEELFVAQVLIKKVKLKCCGIKEKLEPFSRPPAGTYCFGWYTICGRVTLRYQLRLVRWLFIQSAKPS